MSNDDSIYLNHRARQSRAQAEQASCPEARRVQNELAKLYAAALRSPLASTR